MCHTAMSPWPAAAAAPAQRPVEVPPLVGRQAVVGGAAQQRMAPPARPSASVTTPARSAASRSSPAPPSSASAEATMLRSSLGARAATPRARPASPWAGGEPVPESSSRRSSTGRTGGSGASPALAGGQVSARLPAARAGCRWSAPSTGRRRPAPPPGASMATAASRGRAPERRGGRSGPVEQAAACAVRWANTKPTRSASQRWAAKTSDFEAGRGRSTGRRRPPPAPATGRRPRQQREGAP